MAFSVSAFSTVVFAMARTSSRLNAMGLEVVLRFRMLSRRAFFLEGFSMMVDFLAGAGAGLVTAFRGARVGTGAFVLVGAGAFAAAFTGTVAFAFGFGVDL